MGSLLSCFIGNDNSVKKKPNKLNIDKSPLKIYKFDKLHFRSPSSSEEYLLNSEDETSDIDICYTSKLD
jgi:hypothetical protein